MANKKDLIIAVLATFCLTVSIFMIFPTRSAEPYDPWGDVTGPIQGVEDGTINMRDIQYEIMRFNTFGDTTKNVNVTNLPLDEQGNLRVAIVAPQPTHHLVDSIDIPILELSSGVNIWDPARALKLPFSFSPKGSSVNITGIWVLLHFTWDSSWYQAVNGTVSITINDAANMEVTSIYQAGEFTFSSEIRDSTFLQAIEPYRINTFATTVSTYSGLLNSLRATKISITIEYEYLI